MKRTVPLAFAACFLLAGCHRSVQNAAAPSSPGDDSQPTSRVILIGAAKFPASLAGVWENEEHGWILRIEKDGTVSKIRHTIGRADIQAGRTAAFPLINDGFAAVKPGPWYTQYDAAANLVTIEINIEEFVYHLGTGDVVRGSSRDLFIGQPPAKGQQTWTVQWISFPEFIASTGDQKYLDYKLPIDPGDEDKGEITFKKVPLPAGKP